MKKITSIDKYRRRKYRKPVLAALLVLCFLLLMDNKVFVLRRVLVDGNTKMDDNSIIDVADVSYGKSLRKLDLSEIEQKFSNFGRVELLSVYKQYPSTLCLSVRERKIYAVSDIYGYRVSLDEYGVVVQKEQKKEESTSVPVPMISWSKIAEYELGHTLVSDEVGLVQAYLNVIQTLSKCDMLSDVETVFLENQDAIRLQMRSGMIVKLGDRENMEKKVRLAQCCIETEQKRNHLTGTIDVSAVDKGYYSPE